MIVAGGTYLERCSEPGPEGPKSRLAGSGLRAAAALSQLDPDLRFVSAIDQVLAEEAEVTVAGLGIETAWSEREQPVSFNYWTPLSPPTIDGASATAEIEVHGEAALVFGMLEGRSRAKAKALVFDPQQPRDLGPLDLDGLEAERLAIVANAGETRALGGVDDVAEGARRLLEGSGAEVVITKRAARGLLVTTAESQVSVGPVPTERVWPIGSGDVFGAAFAWAWAEQGHDPIDAARAGSRAAAAWCGHQIKVLSAADLEAGDELEVQDGRVYLAGPFFSLGQRWLVALVRGSLLGLGGEVFSPFHEIGFGGDEVAAVDLEALGNCQAILALMDEADTGTAFEGGWATRSETPVIVYAEDGDAEALKMLRGSGAEVHSDLPTAVYRALWASMGLDL